jgi:hypothetical protein
MSQRLMDHAPDLTDPEMPPRWVRVLITLLLTILLVVAPIFIVVNLALTGALVRISEEPARAMLGVPWAGGAALIVVLILRTAFGAVEFKILGVEFRGASGPIIMFLLCFLAETLAIQLLW